MSNGYINLPSSTAIPIDNSFIFQDDNDSSKQFRFECSGVTSGQTRILTVPDLSDILVLLTATQTLTNKTLSAPLIMGVSDAVQLLVQGFSTQTNDIFQVKKSDNNVLFSVDNSGNGVFSGNLTVSGTTTTINSTILNVTDANITVNNGGNQSSANLNKAGLTINVSDGTNAVIGFASSLNSRFKCGDSGSEVEIVTVSHTQTLVNKTLTSPTIAQILNSGTLTLPTSTDTLVGRSTTDTLSNKTLTAPQVLGVSDTLQLLVKGNGTQTNNLFEVKKSDNASLFSVNNSGNGSFSGSLSASNFSGTSSGTNTGDISLGAVGGAPNGNGLSLVGQVLNLQPADASNPGVITTGNQIFSGVKTFDSPSFTTKAAFGGMDFSVLSSGITLANNQSTLASLFTYSASTYPFSFIKYSIVRSTSYQTGLLLIVSDGTSATLTEVNRNYVNSDAGISFDVAIAAGTITVKYVSTNTGNTGTFKCLKEQWS
jgi:hypothetical protein